MAGTGERNETTVLQPGGQRKCVDDDVDGTHMLAAAFGREGLPKSASRTMRHAGLRWSATAVSVDVACPPEAMINSLSLPRLPLTIVSPT